MLSSGEVVESLPPFWREGVCTYQNFKFVESSAQQFHFKDFIYLKEVTGQKDVCTKMFNAALFTVMQNWKHSKCPTIEDNLRQLRHTRVCLPRDSCQRQSRG